jgi:ParB family transcriptional regulator, chromosome partitioning protein
MTTAAQKEQVIVQEIALEQLEASLNNPRRTMNEADLRELAASIREHGIQVPLLVRPLSCVGECGKLPDGYELDEPGYEIVAGHRRSEAATIAGLTSVPCIVRELTDEQAAEIALIDNLQRVDVPAMEEAEAFGELLDRLLSVAAVAAKVGKEQAYVAKRLKLRSCTLCTRDALREQLITVDHALLLARLGDDEQNQALKWTLDANAGSRKPVEDVLLERIEDRKPSAKDEDDDDTEQAVRRARWRHEWEPQSVQRLKEHIERHSGVPLDRAPWPMAEDWLLPDVGSCLDCPQNTKANAPLFGDLDMGVAVCTDGGCFKAKTQGFVLHGIETAKKSAALPILRVSWQSTSTAPRFEKVPICKCAGGKNCSTGEGCRGVPKLMQTFKDGQWVEAKKKCEHARAAVTVDWSDVNNRGYMGREDKLRRPGEIVQACIDPKCKLHPKNWATKPASKPSAAPQKKKDPAEEKRQAELAEHRGKQEGAIRKTVWAACVGKLDAKATVRILADDNWDAKGLRKRFRKEWPKATDEQVECLVALDDAISFDIDDVDGDLLVDQSQVKEDREPLWAFAKSLGLDADQIAARHFHERGSIAPASDVLYPHGVPWPKTAAIKAAPPTKPVVKKAAKKTAGKKGGAK